jgi:hypothetical protein
MAVPSAFGLLLLLGLLGVLVAGVVVVVVFVARQSGGRQADNPNLRPCPDCQQYISVRATVCPKCGGPVKG